jgi:hypothetical protein
MLISHTKEIQEKMTQNYLKTFMLFFNPFARLYRVEIIL